MSEIAFRSRASPEVVRAPSSFVGRERDVLAVTELLRTSRLITLTGAGGIGKTRLALEIRADLAGRYRDGVWLVELGGLRADDDVAEAVVAALGLTTSTTENALSQLRDELQDAHLLLVLDNCEHLLAPVRRVVDAVLRSTGDVTVLATSREPLGISGERVVGLAPLGVPSGAVARDLVAARQSSAVRLLEDRAAAAGSGFVVDGDNLVDAVAIVTSLDGLPLAIELAAVRLRSLSARDLVERMGDRFTMLTRGNAAALPQHRTLRAVVEWSLELCTASERALWARMSVFAGSADLDAVLAVCDHDVTATVLLDDLDSLVAKSIVTVETVGGTTRYRLLETLAELGREQLIGAGQSDTLRERHAAHYRESARRFAERFWGPDQLDLVQRTTVDQNNLRQAFDHLLARRVDHGQAALQMVTDLRGLWLARSQLREGRRWTDTALSATSGGTASRVAALYTVVFVCVMQNDPEAAARRMEELTTAAADLGEPLLEHRSLMWTGVFGVLSGAPRDGVAALERTTRWFAAAGDPEGSVMSSWILIIGLALLGRHDDARAAGERGVRLARDTGQWGLSYILWGSAHAAWAAGDHARAIEVARESLAVKYAYTDDYGIALVLGVMSGAVLDSGDPVRAATLLGVASAAFGTSGGGYASLGPGLGTVYLDVDSRTLTALGAEAYDAAHAFGRAMTTAEARAFVLDESSDPVGPTDPVEPSVATPPSRSVADTVLSPRELEVAGLVARGLSNRAIADELVLSHRTVEGHVERILAKLGFRNRVEIAAWVVGGGAGSVPDT